MAINTYSISGGARDEAHAFEQLCAEVRKHPEIQAINLRVKLDVAGGKRIGPDSQWYGYAGCYDVDESG